MSRNDIAGNMNKDDKRNFLIFDAIEIIKKIKPKYIFLENVQTIKNICSI